MHHEATLDRPRQPWEAPRLVEQPAVNAAASGAAPASDGSVPSSTTS